MECQQVLSLSSQLYFSEINVFNAERMVCAEETDFNCNSCRESQTSNPPGYCGGCMGGGCDAYDNGINDKRRDSTCPCSSPEARRSHGMGTSGCGSECPYQREMCNKKAMSSCCTGLSEVEYKPEVVNNKPVLPSCCCEGGPYEKDHLVNKKPSICSPCGPERHRNCEPPKQCHLGEYRTRPEDIPDRKCFYSDEECGTSVELKRCHNVGTYTKPEC